MPEAAHELNNVLLVVQGLATMLGRRYPDDVRTRADVEEILAATSRGAALVRRITSAAPGTIAGPLDVGTELAAAVADELPWIAGPGAELVLEVEEELPPVRYERLAFRGMLAALVRRAGDALAGRGRVTVRATRGTGFVVLSVAAADEPEKTAPEGWAVFSVYLPFWD